MADQWSRSLRGSKDSGTHSKSRKTVTSPGTSQKQETNLSKTLAASVERLSRPRSRRNANRWSWNVGDHERAILEETMTTGLSPSSSIAGRLTADSASTLSASSSRESLCSEASGGVSNLSRVSTDSRKHDLRTQSQKTTPVTVSDDKSPLVGSRSRRIHVSPSDRLNQPKTGWTQSPSAERISKGRGRGSEIENRSKRTLTGSRSASPFSSASSLTKRSRTASADALMPSRKKSDVISRLSSPTVSSSLKHRGKSELKLANKEKSSSNVSLAAASRSTLRGSSTRVKSNSASRLNTEESVPGRIRSIAG